jgi:hypothetical protein
MLLGQLDTTPPIARKSEHTITSVTYVAIKVMTNTRLTVFRFLRQVYIATAKKAVYNPLVDLV